MDWIIALVSDLTQDTIKGGLASLMSNFRTWRAMRKLKSRLTSKILKKYGNRVYYNSLDSFLAINNVIPNVIRNCHAVNINEYRCEIQTVEYYIALFLERYPQHIYHRSELYTFFQDCFNTIFTVLNDSKASEDIRIICNVAKELSGTLSSQLQEIKTALDGVNQKLDGLREDHTVGQVSIENYFSYLMRLCANRSTTGYIPRQIYKTDVAEATDSLTALQDQRRILLLGEAGFGKTCEAVDLLDRLCHNQGGEGYVPFFLSLGDYGVQYQTIMDGLAEKIKHYCTGDPQPFIMSWMAKGEAVLILDGIDDIPSDEDKGRFASDVNNLSIVYDKCCYFITGREAMYSGKLINANIHRLTSLSRETVCQKLFEEGIRVRIPDIYYQLFENPMFFNVGKNILKSSPNSDLFNRSAIFENLFLLLCGQWNEQKGVSVNRPLSYSEILSLIGHIAYEYFDRPFFTLLEFDQYVSNEVQHHNKARVISFLTGTGIFRIADKITFAHKLFKEYFAANYLISQYPLKDNRERYLKLVNSKNWREVFVFASGIFRKVEEQDEYLDFIMDNNLNLYLECVNGKNDLSPLLEPCDSRQRAIRYLQQIRSSYLFIINKYFYPIRDRFAPLPGRNDDSGLNQIQIVGSISGDGKYLHYWFDRVKDGEAEIICLAENELAEHHMVRELDAVIHRRNISSFGINLELSGLHGDSGRKIAADRIKDELKDILDNRQLIESKYLFCERLSECSRGLKQLRGVTNAEDMKVIVDCMISEAKARTPNMEGYQHDGVDMLYLQALLNTVVNAQIDYQACLLPDGDTRPDASSYWGWEVYSYERMKERIRQFFLYHQLSYLEMAEANFPALFDQFSRHRDAPYKNVVLFSIPNETGFQSEPRLTVYHVASPSGGVVSPEIIECTEEERRAQRRSLFDEIKQSYINTGKTARSYSYFSCGFTITTTSNRKGVGPLSERVYASLKSSLEEVLGQL